MKSAVVDFNKKTRAASMPELRAGDTVKVYRKIMEGGKERIQLFEGIIIGMKGGQSSSPTITVRKVSDGIGVELILPIFSPSIEKIVLAKRAKVRRAKLYYIREKSTKALKFKYRDLPGTTKKETTKKEAKVSEAATEEQAA